ncbi:hypothetical protein KR026_000305, partial [Drosophila bipectinata]
KNYREKVKSNKELSEIVRVKNAERMRTYRKNLKNKLKENQAFIDNVKTYNRNRMQSYRNKLKEGNLKDPEHSIASSNNGYKCKNTLYKALKKVEMALPKDIQKKKDIIKLLVEKYLTDEDEHG